MCIFYVQLLWEYLAICQRAHNHSLTSPESREETVKFIASESKSRKSFLTCPPPMANVASAVYTCVCVCGGVCLRGCVCCVSLSCLHLLILYSNFRLMHMTLIRLHPVGGLDLSSPFSPPACACPSFIIVIFFRLDVCKGNHAFKALYLFTPLAP